MRLFGARPSEPACPAHHANGERFETYTIAGEHGSGAVVVDRAAARLVQPGDRIMVLSHGGYHEQELAAHEPRVVHVDADNRVAATAV